LGELIDADKTYINGVKVGETGYRYPPRKYKVSAGLLREGINLIAVRLIIMSGAGGFVPEHPYYLITDEQKTSSAAYGTMPLKPQEKKLPSVCTHRDCRRAYIILR
jgi:sialate O-acetylesterase